MIRFQIKSIDVLDGDPDKRLKYRYVGLASERYDLPLNEGDEFYSADTDKLYILLGGEYIEIPSSGDPYEDATVEGVFPLSLPDAGAKPISAFVRYGEAHQADTPTPDDPQDIVCNNGTLTVKDEKLPYGYRRIESIEFSGSTYYETDEKLYGSDIVTMTISLSSSGGQNLFGCYSGTASDDVNFSLYVYGTPSGQAYWRYGTTLYRPTLGGTAKRTISFGAGGTTGFSTNSSYIETEFETTSTARIGALPNSSSPKFSGTIYGNITIGTRLKYIPCIRSSDSAVGYYETVKGVFLEPQGSAPVAGAYDNTHFVPYVNGTAEVITLGTQTASVESLLGVGNYKDEQEIITGSVTRKVKVYIFDGTEAWTLPGGADYFRLDGMFEDAIPYASDSPAIICSHFVGRIPKTSASGMVDGDIKLGYTSTYNRLYLKYAAMATEGDLKAWFASQAAAGTPVIVIYPLDEEITETVTAQPLSTAEGDNTITSTDYYATGSVTYKKEKED